MEKYDNLKNIPVELKNKGLWCGWKLTAKGKLPFNAIDGTMAKSNKPETFVNYPVMMSKLCNFAKTNEKGEVIGGLGLGCFNGYSAIDIDDCVENGKLSDMAQDIVDYCNSYTEYSPSGKGIRIIFKTKTILDKEKYYIHNTKIGLEIYLSDQTSKFVTITGNTLGISAEVMEVNVDSILEKYMSRDDALLRAIKHDEKLNELWNSTASGSGGNESETDLALCDKLAFYLKGDYKAIEDAFIQSPYYASKDEAHKKKWQRGDYRQNTINMAISTMTVLPINQNQLQNDNKLTIFKSSLCRQTDTGNARYFIKMFGDNIRYNTDNKKWMSFNGKYWVSDADSEVRSRIELLAESLSIEASQLQDEMARKLAFRNIQHILNSAGKDALLKEASNMPDVIVNNSDFNRNEYMLNCDNVMVELHTGTLLPHDIMEFCNKSTHIEVDTHHEPTRWLEFLDTILEGNTELINYIHKLLGYCASDYAGEQQMWIFFGDGGNGKSLFLDVINTVLGDYSGSAKPTLLTEQPNGNSNLNAIAMLQGKRFVVVEELKANDRLDESLVKSLTSGTGEIHGKFLYANEFTFCFKGKMIMASNYLPKIKGTDDGIWRRVKVIPFNKKFTEETADKHLREKLLQEAPQILGWIVKGYKKYLQEGLTAPSIVKDLTSQYREENDTILAWFNENCKKTNSLEDKIPASMLYQNYYNWCRINNEQALTNTVFGKWMMNKKIKRVQLSTGRVYQCIVVRTEHKINDVENMYANLTGMDEDV